MASMRLFMRVSLAWPFANAIRLRVLATYRVDTNMITASEEFRRAMSAAGLVQAGEIYPDGKLHRFNVEGDDHRNSWYVLYSGPPAAGAFGCWKRDVKQTWCERNGNLSQAETQRIRRTWEEANAKLKKEIAGRQQKARQTANWIFKRAKPVETHPYLSAKRVQPFGDLREYRGTLVLPLRDIDSELQSLQFIGPDGSKKFLTGGRVGGC